MSAPRTNVETQARWHRGPIIGMIVVVIFALSLLFWQMMSVADEGQPQDNGVDAIDGRTGEPVPETAPTGGTTPDGDVPTTPDGDPPAEAPADPVPAEPSPALPATPPAPVPNTNTQP